MKPLTDLDKQTIGDLIVKGWLIDVQEAGVAIYRPIFKTTLTGKKKLMSKIFLVKNEYIKYIVVVGNIIELNVPNIEPQPVIITEDSSKLAPGLISDATYTELNSLSFVSITMHAQILAYKNIISVAECEISKLLSP